MKIKNFISRISAYKKLKEFRIIKDIQTKYMKYEKEHGYGFDKDDDYDFLSRLEELNSGLEEPYVVTGQNGYFSERIMARGLGDLSLDPEDQEDVDFIIDSFGGKRKKFNSDNIPFFSTTLLGTVEFNYATQSFPAGIEENVFQCRADHTWPILPRLGESEEDFYMRLMEYRIEKSDSFDMSKKEEVLDRTRRLVNKFCKNNNRIWLIKRSDLLGYKVSDGDIEELKYGEKSLEEKKKIIDGLETYEEFINSRGIEYVQSHYSSAWGDSEHGITVYGIVPPEKLRYIEVERRYQLLQRAARSEGYSDGDEIPLDILTTRKGKTM